MRIHLSNGRFAPKTCGDANCDGAMVVDIEPVPWGERRIIRCDGLTHHDDLSPLVACPVKMEIA